MKYGITYQGSKAKIADSILASLPPGRRFCDLFGGGFAMSHAALLSGRYNSVLYNDIDPLLPPLFKKAINGEYSYERFTPEWVSREEFHRLKTQDGYIKYIWSFAGNGKDYLWGEELESIKRKAFDYAVNKIPFNDFPVKGKTITERRLALKHYVKNQGRRLDLEALERLQNLEALEKLQNTFGGEVMCRSKLLTLQQGIIGNTSIFPVTSFIVIFLIRKRRDIKPSNRSTMPHSMIGQLRGITQYFLARSIIGKTNDSK